MEVFGFIEIYANLIMFTWIALLVITLIELITDGDGLLWLFVYGGVVIMTIVFTVTAVVIGDETAGLGTVMSLARIIVWCICYYMYRRDTGNPVSGYSLSKFSVGLNMKVPRVFKYAIWFAVVLLVYKLVANIETIVGSLYNLLVS